MHVTTSPNLPQLALCGFMTETLVVEESYGGVHVKIIGCEEHLTEVRELAGKPEQDQCF